MPGSSESSPSAEVEIGESIEIILNGKRVEAFLSDNVAIFDPHTIHGRNAIRAYAYSLGAENHEAAKAILRVIGREG